MGSHPWMRLGHKVHTGANLWPHWQAKGSGLQQPTLSSLNLPLLWITERVASPQGNWWSDPFRLPPHQLDTSVDGPEDLREQVSWVCAKHFHIHSLGYERRQSLGRRYVGLSVATGIRTWVFAWYSAMRYPYATEASVILRSSPWVFLSLIYGSNMPIFYTPDLIFLDIFSSRNQTPNITVLVVVTKIEHWIQ